MKTKTVFAGILLTLMGSFSHAGNVNPKSMVVFAYKDGPSVSTFLQKEADYVSMPLSVKCDHKDPAKRFEIIAQTETSIINAAGTTNNIRVHSGPVVLSGRPTGKSIGFSSLEGYAGSTQAQLHVLIPFVGTGKDVFPCAAEITKFVQGVKLPDGAVLDYGQIHLGVENPEQYREALLKAIADETSRSMTLLGSNGQVIVSGLESPVFVRQADESHVDLFLNYSLSLRVNK